jgi:hypothetical protein
MEEQAMLMLYEKFSSINSMLQETHNILGPTETELDKDSKLKLRIPRGYIRTVYDFRQRLNCITDKVLKYNIAYQLQLSDFYSWILTRTDIGLSVREMLIKWGIILVASNADSLTAIFTTKNMPFKDRLKRLVKSEKISQSVQEEMIWLWDTRDAVHPHKQNKKEYNKYGDAHYNRAVIAVRDLLIELNKC